MSNEAAIVGLGLKPKVYRVPFTVTAVNEKVSKNSRTMLLVVCGGCLLLFVAVVVWYLNHNSSTSKAELVKTDNSGLVSAAVADDYSSKNTPKNDRSTLYFKDNEDAIIGQMAKVSSKSEKAPTPKTEKRDLLDIIGKY